jgi:hypothetical protein
MTKVFKQSYCAKQTKNPSNTPAFQIHNVAKRVTLYINGNGGDTVVSWNGYSSVINCCSFCAISFSMKEVIIQQLEN